MGVLTLSSAELSNPYVASEYEWLETNGLGGFASASVTGANTRRYHGLLVAAIDAPTERMVMLSKLDESIVFAGAEVSLATNFYPGTVYPQGFKLLRSFTRDIFPTWEYAALGIVLRKTIAMIHGQNTVVVHYEILKAPAPFILRLRPLVAARSYHALVRANDGVLHDALFKGDLLNLKPYVGIPGLFLRAPKATFQHQPEWFMNFEYYREQERGFEFREDLFTYGVLDRSLSAGDSWGVVASINPPAPTDSHELLATERKRREQLLKVSKLKSETARTLVLAADQFLVKRGEGDMTIIAGYPWFTDWGRDSMIARNGLCLATKRFADARSILGLFVRHMSEGMIPNLFPDGKNPPLYNTVDATLWFFVAAHRYLTASGDKKWVREVVVPVLLEMLDWHYRGTRYGIRADTDSLLLAGDPSTQLTWMDARVGSWAVTPRNGKAVEVNALWFNAHACLAAIAKAVGRKDLVSQLDRKMFLIRESFNRTFWNEDGGYLYDCVDGDRKDATIRPNQIFALSLPFPLLGDERGARVLATVRKKLLTPKGLRTLDPEHPSFRPEYSGNHEQRDSAYHQGTVWAWLLGAYATAVSRYAGKRAKDEIREILAGVPALLREGCIGSVSEIFDATASYHCKGAPAQAWSVAELLRAFVEHGE